MGAGSTAWIGIVLATFLAAGAPAGARGQDEPSASGRWAVELGFGGFPESLGGSCMRRRTETTTWFSLGIRHQRRAGRWRIASWVRVEQPYDVFHTEECPYGTFGSARYGFSPGTSAAVELGVGQGFGETFVMAGPGFSLDTRLFRIFASANYSLGQRWSLGVRGRLIRIPYEGGGDIARDVRRESSETSGVDWRPSFEFTLGLQFG